MTKLKEKQNIPEGWRSKKLGQYLDIEKGKLPKLIFDTQEEDMFPYLSIKYFKGEEKRYASIDKCVFATESDLLVIGDGSGSGRMYRGYSGLVSSTFLKISSSKKDFILDDYLENLFTYFNFSKSQFRKGGAIPHFDFQRLKEVDVLIPPIKEQQKIAEILGSVDEDIEKTKEVIATTEKLKKGLMQDLFTRGIGHTKFKETELGEIPEGWDVGGFEDLVNEDDKNAIKPGPFGSALKKEFYVADGYKIYGQEQVIKDNPYYGDYYVDEEKYKTLEGFKVQPKDILISLVGTIGKTLIVPDDAKKGIINPRLLKITLNHEIASVKFVEYLLRSPLLIKQMAGKSHGGTMSILNKGMLMSVKLPIPKKKEQEEIAEILSSVDEKISVNKKLLEKQTQLKKGLMQDLLSGVKRVKV